MNFSKSKVLLKKLNAIHDSGASFDNQLSSLERDLLLQYLRELSECVLDQDDKVQEKIAQVVQQKEIKEITVEKVEVIAAPEPAVISDPDPPAVETPTASSNGHEEKVEGS